MAAVCTSAPRFHPEESGIKNCLRPSLLRPNFGYGDSRHAGWSGAGLGVGAGVIFAAGLYKTTLADGQKKSDDTDIGEKSEKAETPTPAGAAQDDNVGNSSPEVHQTVPDDSNAPVTSQDVLRYLPKKNDNGTPRTESPQQSEPHLHADHLALAVGLLPSSVEAVRKGPLHTGTGLTRNRGQLAEKTCPRGEL
ncbi:Hypp3712 [Branchiostoma lanceolatum]|uniref:Hypp3712 protein n=1 Tax=Branchiostoma lanceolatum TaxID=7740 RepID=A0A8K0A485_BRALA|nr:Hypp3712 [Branchiostoma lanceolatum]